jgi:hypothetical protein
MILTQHLEWKTNIQTTKTKTKMLIQKIITIILSGFVGFLIGRLIYKILNNK